jgi:alpha-L-fucosidase
VGLSTHYFPRKADEVEDVARAFQTEKVAEQAAEAGAAWFLLTLHHQPWLMMAPNKTYDDLLGHSRYTSDRDLPLDLHKALRAKGIRLMIYVNLRLDPGSACNRVDRNIPKAMGGWPPNDTLIGNLATVYREFSLRYGEKVAGWWVDGTWLGAYKTAPDREKWFARIVEALRAGNPQAAVAFNPGANQFSRYSPQNDYVAGESAGLERFPGKSRWRDGAQWHVWMPLGEWWGNDGLRYGSTELSKYAQRVASEGGVLTFEVGTMRTQKTKDARPIGPVGIIDPAQVEQVKAVTRALKK